MIFCRWFATLPVIAAVALVAVLPVTTGEAAVPKRIVTLAPSLTELVYAAGAGDQLVAVSAFSDFPPEAKRLPQVSDASGIAWESLLAQKPDLVLAWQDGTRPADIARLQSLRIDVAILTIRTLDDVPIALRKIGALTGRASASVSAASAYTNRLGALRQANANKPIVKTFFEISALPLMTINRLHVISDVITLCRGENVFADAPTLVSEPSREALLARGADAILHTRSARNPSFENAQYVGLAALQAMRVYRLTADFAYRPGPRLLLSAEEVCEALDRARAPARGR